MLVCALRQRLAPQSASGPSLFVPRASITSAALVALSCSLLHLLLLFLLHGRYADAIRLVDTCSTDNDLSPEEAQLWALLSHKGDDDADAHAARLKLYLSTLDTPTLACPWELRPSLDAYILRRTAVSAACRLTTEEELLLLQKVLDESEPSTQHEGASEETPLRFSREVGAFAPPYGAATNVSSSRARMDRLREYRATLMEIHDMEMLGADIAPDLPISFGAVRPRSSALQSARWIDLEILPERLLSPFQTTRTLAMRTWITTSRHPMRSMKRLSTSSCAYGTISHSLATLCSSMNCSQAGFD